MPPIEQPKLTQKQQFNLLADRLRLTTAVRTAIYNAAIEGRPLTEGDFQGFIDQAIAVIEQSMRKEKWCRKALKKGWGL